MLPFIQFLFPHTQPTVPQSLAPPNLSLPSPQISLFLLPLDPFVVFLPSLLGQIRITTSLHYQPRPDLPCVLARRRQSDARLSEPPLPSPQRPAQPTLFFLPHVREIVRAILSFQGIVVLATPAALPGYQITPVERITPLPHAIHSS